MVDETANESGVLTYHRFISDDGMVCHAVERYESCDAALAHLAQDAVAPKLFGQDIDRGHGRDLHDSGWQSTWLSFGIS